MKVISEVFFAILIAYVALFSTLYFLWNTDHRPRFSESTEFRMSKNF